MMRLNPWSLIMLGFVLLCAGVVSIFLMVIRVLEPSFFLSFLGYALSLLGLVLGLVGVARRGPGRQG
jgi:hypothetical protein